MVMMIYLEGGRGKGKRMNNHKGKEGKKRKSE